MCVCVCRTTFFWYGANSSSCGFILLPSLGPDIFFFSGCEEWPWFFFFMFLAASLPPPACVCVHPLGANSFFGSSPSFPFFVVIILVPFSVCVLRRGCVCVCVEGECVALKWVEAPPEKNIKEREKKKTRTGWGSSSTSSSSVNV